MEAGMTAPAAGKQWATMSSDEKLDFVFAWCTSMDRAIEFEKAQAHLLSTRVQAMEERTRLESH
jgi:hypothetical protein